MHAHVFLPALKLALPAVSLLHLLYAAASGEQLRVATFNLSLYGERAGQVLARLERGDDPQARRLAEIIQRVRPQVLLLNEIDYDPGRQTLRCFCEKYLAVGQNSLNLPDAAEPIEYAHQFSAPTNTGRHSGLDLNRDGVVQPTPGSDAYAADCWGYGRYEGQYGMAILSQYPIDRPAVRTFRDFRWRSLPGADLPDDPSTPQGGDWYLPDVLERFPLSSKSHWDVPVTVLGQRIHLLASHPTPPVFDGAEDRNGRRNRDEIRFWADYIDPTAPGPHLQDDNGKQGGLPPATSIQPPASSNQSPAPSPPPASFIILGDLNSDPHDGDGSAGIARLLASPRLNAYPPPQSLGAAEQARLQGGANLRHRGDPRCDTCDPADASGPGNLRIDYVLPSADLEVTAAGVFWPEASDPLFPLVGVHPFPSSDHRLVWVDLELNPPENY